MSLSYGRFSATREQLGLGIEFKVSLRKTWLPETIVINGMLMSLRRNADGQPLINADGNYIYGAR